MKRQNLIIMLIVIVALWSCGAIAKDIPNREPNEEYTPGLCVQPGSKIDPIAPNEQCIPGLAAQPGSKAGFIQPQNDVPIQQTEYAPIELTPMPTAPQLAPAPPLRGVTPVPPPRQGPGGGWNNRTNPSKWMWLSNMFNLGE